MLNTSKRAPLAQWIRQGIVLSSVLIASFSFGSLTFAADEDPAPTPSATSTSTTTETVLPTEASPTLTATEALLPGETSTPTETLTPTETPSLDEAQPAAGLAPQQLSRRAFLPRIVSSTPGAFAKVTPAGNATGIPATGVVLSWTVSNLATSYEVCLSQSVVAPCLDGTGFNRTASAAAHSLHSGALAPGQVYFWHVRARNSSGVTYSDGGTGQARQFRVTPLPGAFNKSGPGSGTTGHAATGITLTWSASANATAYAVCLGTSPAVCTNPANYNRHAGASTSYNTGPLAGGTTYYWNVRATNNNGVGWAIYANGNINQVWNMTTLALPGAFNKLLPANGSAPSTVALTWQPASGAAYYQLCVDANPARCVDGGGGFTLFTANTTYSPGGLTPGQTYFWHVRAHNASGGVYSQGSGSAVWNFVAPAGTGGTTPCNASPAAQNTNYTAQQNRSDIYFSIFVGQASTVDLSLTGATGQLQFRTPNLSVCPNHTTSLIDFQPTSGGSASLRYYNVTPGTYIIRIATTTPGSNNFTFRWSATSGYTFYEPNNTACAASNINVNTNYTAYPENSRPDVDLGSGVGAENDYYQFSLGAQTTVQIQFSGYNGGSRQVQLRSGSCASSSVVDNNAFIADAPSGTIQKTLPAGTYWVRFITLNGTQSRTAYTLNVSTGGTGGVPKVDTCNPSGSPGCDSQTGPNATIYWFNMPSGTNLSLRLDGQSISGGTCGSQAQGRVYGPVVIGINQNNSNGSYSFTGVGNGYYVVSASWSGAATGADSKPLKISCTLLLAAPEVLGPSLDGEGVTPRPTPIPMPGETPTPTPTPEAAPRLPVPTATPVP